MSCLSDNFAAIARQKNSNRPEVSEFTVQLCWIGSVVQAWIPLLSDQPSFGELFFPPINGVDPLPLNKQFNC